MLLWQGTYDALTAMGAAGIIPAILVFSRNSLYATPPGGVQICTREFIDTLSKAGLTLTLVEYDTDQRAINRLRRRLWSHPYADRVPPTVVPDIVRAQETTRGGIVFLCGVELAEIAERLRSRLKSPDVRLVLFSYGLKSVDFLHNIRINGDLNSRRSALTLGRLLLAETKQRRHLDQVLCLSPFEVTIENWLGAKKVDWIPRTIPSQDPLDWKPEGDRVGCVCTLHHGPNVEGLLLFLKEFRDLAPPNVRFRLVGQPAVEGEQIAKKFQNVDYLGHLDDKALRQEASSWNCLVHPLFCYAAGASMKLTTALAWQIPIVTTTLGRRGYVWKSGEIPMADDPTALANLTLLMLDSTYATTSRDRILEVVATSPTLEDVAVLLKQTVLGR